MYLHRSTTQKPLASQQGNLQHTIVNKILIFLALHSESVSGSGHKTLHWGVASELPAPGASTLPILSSILVFTSEHNILTRKYRLRM